MRRALIVKTTSMGDVIHALPAVADLARAQPDLSIDWVVEKSFSDIPRLSRYVNQVHEVAVRQWRKNVFNRLGKRSGEPERLCKAHIMSV